AARARLATSNGTLAVYASSSPADLQAQARCAVEQGYELIVAAGGDGTLLGVLQGGGGADVTLTRLPLGTCNDYAKALGIRDERDALRTLMTGSARSVDLGTCTYVGLGQERCEAIFCLSAGLGFSAALARAESSRWLTCLKEGLGKQALVLASAKLVATY